MDSLGTLLTTLPLTPAKGSSAAPVAVASQRMSWARQSSSERRTQGVKTRVPDAQPGGQPGCRSHLLREPRSPRAGYMSPKATDISTHAVGLSDFQSERVVVIGDRKFFQVLIYLDQMLRG
jgi:hypothetical protein